MKTFTNSVTKLAVPIFVLSFSCQAVLAQKEKSDDIIIGRTLPLEGPTKSYGVAKLDGGDAYLNMVNAKGGINGRKIRVVTMNDSYTPVTAIENLRKIAAENEPLAFLGIFGIPVVTAVMPVINELKIPTVGLTAGSEEMRKPVYRYSFPVRADYASETKRLVTYIKTINMSGVGVVYTDNAYGKASKLAMEAELEKQQIKFSSAMVVPTGTDADAAAKKLMIQKPQVVFLGMLTQAAIPSIRALRSNGYKGNIYSMSPLDGTQIVKEMKEEAANIAMSQVVPNPGSLRTSIAREYHAALKELGHGEPSFYGLEGFIEAKVLVEGIRRAGNKFSRESLVTALETLDDFDLGGLRVSYKPQLHQGSTFTDVDRINVRELVTRK